MGYKKHNANTMQQARATQSTTFGYSDHVKSSAGVAQSHMSLHPAYGGLRKCLNTADQLSEMISVWFDITGSNIQDARRIHADLPQLMQLLAIQGWIPNAPMLQFGAIGDIRAGDDVGFQISQFEQEGVKADAWLNNIYLEGGGCGNQHENYDLAFWAAVHQNYFEGWEQGRKGNLIILFDEKIYPEVSVRDLERTYNQTVANTTADGGVGEISAMMSRRSLEHGVVLPTHNIPTKEVVAELKEKYDVLCIMCTTSGYYQHVEYREDHLNNWKSYFGEESVTTLSSPDDISEMIAGWLGAKYGIVPRDQIINMLTPLVGHPRSLDDIKGMMAKQKFLPSVSGSLGNTPMMHAGNGAGNGNALADSGGDTPFKF